MTAEVPRKKPGSAAGVAGTPSYAVRCADPSAREPSAAAYQTTAEMKGSPLPFCTPTKERRTRRSPLVSGLVKGAERGKGLRSPVGTWRDGRNLKVAGRG